MLLTHIRNYNPILCWHLSVVYFYWIKLIHNLHITQMRLSNTYRNQIFTISKVTVLYYYSHILIPADSRTRKTHTESYKHIYASQNCYKFSFSRSPLLNVTPDNLIFRTIQLLTPSENNYHLMVSHHLVTKPGFTTYI